tara:strand:+ start:8774 stop:10252 length:1479 start_codon:yes stop_codon:yes gene_type:complete
MAINLQPSQSFDKREEKDWTPEEIAKKEELLDDIKKVEDNIKDAEKKIKDAKSPSVKKQYEERINNWKKQKNNFQAEIDDIGAENVGELSEHKRNPKTTSDVEEVVDQEWRQIAIDSIGETPKGPGRGTTYRHGPGGRPPVNGELDDLPVDPKEPTPEQLEEYIKSHTEDNKAMQDDLLERLRGGDLTEADFDKIAEQINWDKAERAYDDMMADMAAREPQQWELEHIYQSRYKDFPDDKYIIPEDFEFHNPLDDPRNPESPLHITDAEAVGADEWLDNRDDRQRLMDIEGAAEESGVTAKDQTSPYTEHDFDEEFGTNAEDIKSSAINEVENKAGLPKGSLINFGAKVLDPIGEAAEVAALGLANKLGMPILSRLIYGALIWEGAVLAANVINFGVKGAGAASKRKETMLKEGGGFISEEDAETIYQEVDEELMTKFYEQAETYSDFSLFSKGERAFTEKTGRQYMGGIDIFKAINKTLKENPMNISGVNQ